MSIESSNSFKQKSTSFELAQIKDLFQFPSDPILTYKRVSGIVTDYLKDDKDLNSLKPIVHHIFERRIQSLSDSRSNSSFTSVPTLLYSTRPPELQKKIDSIYRSLNSKRFSWQYNGNRRAYDCLRFKDTDVITQRILSAPSKKINLYFLDLGAGCFGWVNATRDFLNSKFKTSKHHFHVIGVTGEGVPHNEIIVTGNVTTHKITGFKIENLLQAFQKFNLNYTNSVEVIHCHWTLQHIVDPLGTLEQAYHLLTPGNGFLFGSGWDEMLNNYLKATFGMHKYIVRHNTSQKQLEFALFRDSYPTDSSRGLQIFEYNHVEPLLGLSKRDDCYAQCRANLKWKSYESDFGFPFGNGFYGTGTKTLKKLLGKSQRTVTCPNGKVLQTSLFKDLFFLKTYLDNSSGRFYEVELPEMPLEQYLTLKDL